MIQRIRYVLLGLMVSSLLLVAGPGRAETPAAPKPVVSLSCSTTLAIAVVDNAALCAGKPVTLKALVPGLPFGNWYWTLNGQKLGYDQQTFLNVQTAGVYSLGGDWERDLCFTGPKALTLTLSGAESRTITLMPTSATVCEGESVTLTADAGTYAGYNWTRNGTNVPNSQNRSVLVVNEPGTYTLGGIASTCISVANQPVVQVNPLPTASIEPSSLTFCEGEVAQINVQTDADNAVRWLRNGVDLGAVRSLTANTAATFSLTATRPGGCFKTVNYTFAPTINPLPVFRLATVPPGDLPFGVSASTAPENPAYRYRWTPAEGVSDPTIARPVFSPLRSTLYTLQITSETGCPYADTLFVPVRYRIHFPTAFSPNGDGQNDTWAPVNWTEYPDAELWIFTRSGELIFSTKAGQAAFDGQLNGEPLPGGAYAYRLSLPSRQTEWRGTLWLVR